MTKIGPSAYWPSTRGRRRPPAASARVHSLQSAAVDLTLALWDTDAPETYDVEIVSTPSHGTLAGSGPSRTYTPNPGFTGQDRFTWRASGDGWTSNTASVVIYANASGENSRPQVDDQKVSVPAGGERLINLALHRPGRPRPTPVDDPPAARTRPTRRR